MPRKRTTIFTIFSISIILASLATAAIAKVNSHERVEIRSDQIAGTVQIVIDGTAVMTVNAKGAHVKGDFDYSGIMTDTQGGSHDQ